jgi:hypothetical protein
VVYQRRKLKLIKGYLRRRAFLCIGMSDFLYHWCFGNWGIQIMEKLLDILLIIYENCCFYMLMQLELGYVISFPLKKLSILYILISHLPTKQYYHQSIQNNTTVKKINVTNPLSKNLTIFHMIFPFIIIFPRT